MITELIQDFSGGINNSDAPNRIAPNQLAAASNCWYDNNSIKARGAFTVGVAAADNTIAWGAKTYTVKMGHGARVFVLSSTSYMFHMGRFTGIGLGPFYVQNPDVQGSGWTSMTYGVGTVATTNGSAVITGSGTSWTGSVRVGDAFTINIAGQTQVGEVLTVDTDTQLTMTANWTTTNAAGTAYRISPTFDASGVPSFEIVNNKVYMTTRTRMPAYWNATSIFNNTNSPICAWYRLFKNYMFAANTSANPSRVSWSTIKDAETWGASNFIDVAPDDGEVITGLFNNGHELIVLKRRSLYRLVGDVFDPSNPTYVLTKIYTPPECVFDSVNSWAIFNGVLTLYGGTGIYQYDGNAVSRLPVSDKLLGTLSGSSWVTASLINFEGWQTGQQAITYNGKYWITSTQTGYGNILVLDGKNNWWQFTPPGANAASFDFFIMPGNGTTTYNSLWTINRNSSTDLCGTYLLDQAFSNEAIAASFTTRVYEYQKKQRFGKAWLHFKRATTGSIAFGYKVDEGTTVNATVDMRTGAGTRAKSVPIMIGRVGQSVQFVIAHSASSEDFEVYAIEFERQDLRL